MERRARQVVLEAAADLDREQGRSADLGALDPARWATRPATTPQPSGPLGPPDPPVIAQPDIAPSDDPGRRPGRRSWFRVGWLRNVVVVALLFVAYQVWGTAFQAGRHQDRLASSFAAGPEPSETSLVLGSGVVARIEIPEIGVDQYVVEGTGNEQTEQGPGHYVGSSMPGRPGNAAIAGHRTTYGAPFNRLNELEIGDQIVTTTVEGSTTYVVTESPRPVSNQNDAVFADYGDDRLTLTTSHPKFTTSQLLVVVAKPKVPFTTAAAGETSVADLSVAGDRGWHPGELPATLLVLVTIAVLARLHVPLARRSSRVMTVAIELPLWWIALLLLFQQLNRLLPANV